MCARGTASDRRDAASALANTGKLGPYVSNNRRYPFITQRDQAAEDCAAASDVLSRYCGESGNQPWSVEFVLFSSRVKKGQFSRGTADDIEIRIGGNKHQEPLVPIAFTRLDDF